MKEKNKIAVITGATGGIGAEVCKYLLSNNYIILASCRNFEKGDKVRKDLEKSTSLNSEERLFFIPIDMCSFSSVDGFISMVKERVEQFGGTIDVLINNAGVISPKFTTTIDGYETSLQVNFLSAKRLTESLIDNLDPVKGKIINTLSCTIHMWEDKKLSEKEIAQQEKEFMSLKNYSNSKLLLSRYTIELNDRLPCIMVCGVDPGIVNTSIITMHRWFDPLANILFRPFIKSVATGAIPMIKAIEYKGQRTTTLLFKGTNHISPLTR
ncbi:MAG: SDR family NAD(P)-dependent oxidoreductase [Rikenellaceae bacterium]